MSENLYTFWGDRFSPDEVKDIIKDFGLRKIYGSASKNSVIDTVIFLTIQKAVRKVMRAIL